MKKRDWPQRQGDTERRRKVLGGLRVLLNVLASDTLRCYALDAWDEYWEIIVWVSPATQFRTMFS